MTLKHHISDDTLLAYVNGTLAETLSVVVATHLAICPQCRKHMDLMLSVGSLYLDQSKPMELSNDELDLCDEIMLSPQEKPAKGNRKSLNTAADPIRSVPKPLSDLLPCDIDDIPWKKLVPGMSHYPLQGHANSDGKGALRLIKISPGMTLPEHSHSGQELTLILRGSYIDEVGRFAAGDISDLDDSLHHQPVADTDKDCICLIATDAPLKFKGFFSRLLQPLIGI